MAKYLITASYSVEGAQGVLKNGGSARRAAVEEMARGLGGKLETFYFAFGESDAIAILDFPDAATAAAASIAVNAAGGVQVTTTPLLTAEEINEACRKSIQYRAPGG